MVFSACYKYKKLIFNSIFYVVNLSTYLVLLKLVENKYYYDNFWFSNLISIAISPIYMLSLFSLETRKRIRLYGKVILFPLAAGICYAIESILLFYSVNNLNLNYYTILRSSFIIWNIPFFVFFLKKKISRIYLFSCLLLLISYTISIYYYISYFGDNWKPTIAIILSCLINATYNNIIEHSLKQYKIQNIDYQLIFQNTYFIISIGPSLYFTIYNPPPIRIDTIIIFFFIASILQFYIYNKIIILRDNSSKIPSNVLMSGLDLIRRFFLLLFSFLIFKEPFNQYIAISIILFIISSILMFIDYFIPKGSGNSENRLEDEIELIP